MKNRIPMYAAGLSFLGIALGVPAQDQGQAQRREEERRQDLDRLYVCPDHPEVTSRQPGVCPKDNKPLQAMDVGMAQRQVLEGMVDASQDVYLDFGGWLRSELLQFSDKPFQKSRGLRFWDFRLWGSARINEIHRFYVRGLMQLNEFNSGDQFGAKEADWRGPNLDQGFYEIDLTEAMKDVGLDDMNRMVARVGRQFFQIGRGITLNTVMDGASVEGQWGYWGFKLLGARNIPSSNDINRSRPDPADSHRFFYGSEIAFLKFPRYRFFGYALFQRDHNYDVAGSSNFPGADFDYNSEYWGLGLRSEPISRVSVQAGYILETGRSGGDPNRNAAATANEERIFAQSANVLAQYYPPIPLQPRVSLEYLWGSGDEDRRSVTNTIGGNNPGSVDKGFLPFGYVNTGIALFPRLSNLHIFHAGAAFRPLDGFEYFDSLELGADFFVYIKDKTLGGISDLRADVADRRVGDEIDVSITWRPLSDLLFAVRYGLFSPGAAYSAATDFRRHFLSAGLTYSF